MTILGLIAMILGVVVGSPTFIILGTVLMFASIARRDHARRY